MSGAGERRGGCGRCCGTGEVAHEEAIGDGDSTIRVIDVCRHCGPVSEEMVEAFLRGVYEHTGEIGDYDPDVFPVSQRTAVKAGITAALRVRSAGESR